MQSPTYLDWIGDRKLATLGTNHGSDALAFQRWHKFKEAFAPEIVAQAIEKSTIRVSRVLDPFGGSGTTALASQLLGVEPLTAEVNPYLQDVIESKLVSYDLESLADSARSVLGSMRKPSTDRWFPPTFVEPGVRERWIFSADLWSWIQGRVEAIETLSDERERRLLRVLLGGTLVPISNVRVSGKGRRYRGSWTDRQTSIEAAASLFSQRIAAATEDIKRFASRPTFDYQLIRGDSRSSMAQTAECQLAVFSPPYPNSFDYTDIYNVELWSLRYLTDMQANRELRRDTLSSHVQIDRSFSAPPAGSPALDELMIKLESQRDTLWSTRIPSMIGAYFADMQEVLRSCARVLVEGAHVWMVVGDSQYGGTKVPVAKILQELAGSAGFESNSSSEARAMRQSPQQGGSASLAETVLVFRRT